MRTTAAAPREQLRFEIAFCGRFLPAGLDEAAVRALVEERVKALGITDKKQIGKLVGDVMASHKGQVEAADVKPIAEEMLGAEVPARHYFGARPRSLGEMTKQELGAQGTEVELPTGLARADRAGAVGARRKLDSGDRVVRRRAR